MGGWGVEGGVCVVSVVVKRPALPPCAVFVIIIIMINVALRPQRR